MKNIFLEGIPGSGKSTLTARLKDKLPHYRAYYEGDLSPVELAWCAYMTQEEYAAAKARHPQYAREMDALHAEENGRVILPYTRVKAQEHEFYADLEQYEIYAGRMDAQTFDRTVLARFERYDGEGAIFECSLFQNIVDELLLYRCMSLEEILAFYREVFARIDVSKLRIVRLIPRDLRASLDHVRCERVDENGVRVWEKALLDYMGAAPYGKMHPMRDFDDILSYYQTRIETESAVLTLLPDDAHTDLVSREYDIDAQLNWLNA